MDIIHRLKKMKHNIHVLAIENDEIQGYAAEEYLEEAQENIDQAITDIERGRE